MVLRHKVLVLDQVGERSHKLAGLLDKAGYAVHCAGNGADGLAMARELGFDLVLLNVQLQNPSVWDVCRRLKQDPATAQALTVIIFPGWSGPPVLMEDFLTGTDGFLDYSLSDAEILARVEHILKTGNPVAAQAPGSGSIERIPDHSDPAGMGIPINEHEIAKLIQAEESLRETKNWLRLVLDAIPVCVHWKNRDSVYIGCNRSFARDAELESPSHIIGKTDFDLPWNRYADFYRSRDRMVIQTGQSLLKYEQPRVASDGRLFWLRQSKLPLRNAAGEIVGVLTIYEDITEQKCADEALRASELKYRELVESANSIVLRMNPKGEIVFINEFGRTFFGYTASEMIGRKVVGSIVPETESTGRNLAALLTDICINPSRYARNINENMRSNGEHVWIDWTNKAVLDKDGGLVEVLSIGVDITSRKHAEEALQKASIELEQRVRERTSELSIANLMLKTESEERLRASQEIERLNLDLERRAAALAAANESLKELDRLKSEFLATMSHELRTPLNSIIGFTGILRQGLAGPVNAEQSKQLGIAYNSAMHLLSLINDLLDISRIEAGKVEWARDAFNFKDVAADAATALSPMAAQKKIAFLTEIPAQGIAMTGDRKRCYQILLNLANNALKFTDHGEVRVTARVSGGRLEVDVADTGIGIKAEHLGMLFEAFRQVDSSAKRVYEGTGLGLHLCKRLLRLIGGDIAVSSEYGKGSCFSFHMPLHLNNLRLDNER